MFTIDRKRCLSCAGCICICPEMALVMDLDGLRVIDDECTLCGICIDFCPVIALEISGKQTQAAGQE